MREQLFEKYSECKKKVFIDTFKREHLLGLGLYILIFTGIAAFQFFVEKGDPLVIGGIYLGLFLLVLFIQFLILGFKAIPVYTNAFDSFYKLLSNRTDDIVWIYCTRRSQMVNAFGSWGAFGRLGGRNTKYHIVAWTDDKKSRSFEVLEEDYEDFLALFKKVNKKVDVGFDHEKQMKFQNS